MTSRTDHAISAIYETVTDPAAWQVALEGMSQLFGARAIALMRTDLSTGTPLEVHQKGHEAPAQDAYTRYYYALDPTIPVAMGARCDEWLLGPDMLSPYSPANAEYVHDYCRPHDLRWIAGARLQDTPGIHTFLSVQRGYDAEPFGAGSARVFARLAPHLRRVLALHRELAGSRLQASLAQASLDAVACAVFVLDARLGIVLANAEGERMLREGVDARSRQRRLGLRAPSDHERLARAVRLACAEHGEGDAFVVTYFGRNVQARVQPLRPTLALPWAKATPLALVLMGDPATTTHRPETFMRLFGLSAAEARLLAALAQGSSPAAYADARSVSIATIRSQLQAIFQKVGVNSQAQLIAIARALPQVRGLG